MGRKYHDLQHVSFTILSSCVASTLSSSETSSYHQPKPAEHKVETQRERVCGTMTFKVCYGFRLTSSNAKDGSSRLHWCAQLSFCDPGTTIHSRRLTTCIYLLLRILLKGSPYFIHQTAFRTKYTHVDGGVQRLHLAGVDPVPVDRQLRQGDDGTPRVCHWVQHGR